jgi:Uma2 family endonuclease
MTPSRGATLGGVALQTEHFEEPFLLNVDQYHQMIDAGILTEEDKVELLEGRLIAMSPEGPTHAAIQRRVTAFLAPQIDFTRHHLAVGNPITIESAASEPEPDFAVIDADAGGLAHHFRSALLVIELSKTSLRKDRVRKAPIYAAAGIPEYWIVDLVNWRVEVHTAPKDGVYTRTQVVERDGVVQAQAVPLPPLKLVELFAD